MKEEKKSGWSPGFWLIVIFILAIGFVVVIVVPKFVRACCETAANGCINNLRQIDAAKNEWALENHKTNGTDVTENDLKPYIKLDSQGNLPSCGAGGRYIIGRIGEDPQCSIGASLWPNIHALNYTNNWWTDFKMAYSRLLGIRSQPAHVLK